MQFQESSVKIYTTTDYALFRLINGNRELDDSKIKRIINDINRGVDVLKYCPLLVKWTGQRLDILDGQNRFYVTRKLRKPVHFVIAEKDLDLYAIACINSNTEKWKPNDFINCYVQLENENYKKLRDFLEKSGFSLSLSIYLLEHGKLMSDAGMTKGKDFERGKLQVKEEAKAYEFYEIAKKFDFFPYWKSRTFLVAVSKLLQANLVEIDDLVGKLKTYQEDLGKEATFKEYLQAMELIYNKKAHNRKSIW